jgi:YgiT-type zinc finger domain-containing protein
MNECLYCKGHLEERLVSRLQEYQGQWYLIENLPALVCNQCHESYFTPAVHDLVLNIVQGRIQAIREETVQVFDASKAS